MPDEQEPEPTHCGKLANYRIDFMTSTGPDHAFACEDDLPKILMPILKVARGGAARVAGLPGSSEEPCELGVE